MFISHEIFNGSIPKVCMQQILHTLDLSDWDKVYVGCSGLFSFERALKKAKPSMQFYGNDVSLMSAAIAGMSTGKPVSFRFKGRVAHWEDLVPHNDPWKRVGALLLVLYLGRVFRTDNEYNAAHWRYYENRLPEMIDGLADQARLLVAEMDLNEYYSGDFRDHLKRGQEQGAALVISAPFIEGWYEKWFKFIEENIEWDTPTYGMWSPDDFPALLDEMDASGSPYLAVYKSKLNRNDLVAYHRRGVKPKFYIYSNSNAKSSLVDVGSLKPSVPFSFSAVQLEDLTENAKIEVRSCLAGNANYVKAMFLQENIMWTQAPCNYLVFINDKLAGCISISVGKHSFGDLKKTETLYLLSDTCVTRRFRLSKLIARLAMTESINRHANATCMKGYLTQGITTTVRSNNPSSMKYRGIFKKLWRTNIEGDVEERSGAKYKIIYGAMAVDQTPEQIYADWYKRQFSDDQTKAIKVNYGRSKAESPTT
jgi:hypothetical protein